MERKEIEAALAPYVCYALLKVKEWQEISSLPLLLQVFAVYWIDFLFHAYKYVTRVSEPFEAPLWGDYTLELQPNPPVLQVKKKKPRGSFPVYHVVGLFPFITPSAATVISCYSFLPYPLTEEELLTTLRRLEEIKQKLTLPTESPNP